ncbi:TPA: TOBE domain-containing protein [Pseudomonas aeruginosa]|nr:TOBE domain-containing protein [Pseudomonas aeruginosa]
MSALSTLAQHVTRRPQRIALLAQIAELGSITRAAKAVGISYKGAWDAIDELNNLAERPLVERSVGGKGGGGARLTAEGERLLALYRRLEALQAQVLQAAEDAEDLNLIGRLMLRTSARNQLHGRVLSIHGEGFHDRIAIELPGQQRIEALITRASTEQLELGRGRPVLALIKAGWLDVGLEPREDQPNQLHGTLEEILATKAGPSEVRIALGSGLTLCALLSGERLASLGLKKGQKVIASFDPAQVLLGTPL